MISISNADRDNAVRFLRAYASLLKGQRRLTSRVLNQRRMAMNLALKLDRKRPLPAADSPGRGGGR